MPKVSILVPIYNVEKYLRECLDSLIKQTLKDIEIICINDGSTDASLKILRDFERKDNRIKVIDKENSGYGASMNMGLRQATGEYIGIVESDDFVKKEMYEDLYNLAIKNNADLVKSDFILYTAKNKLKRKAGLFDINKINRVLSIKDYLRLLKKQPCIWSAIYKKDFLDKNNIDFLETPGASFQDTSFCFKTCVLAQRMYLTNKAYLYYRQDNASSSVHNKSKVFLICQEYEEITKFLNENPEIKKIVNSHKLIKEYGAYMWNLRRIDEEFRDSFIEVFSDTFKKYIENNELTAKFYSKFKKEQVDLLINNKQEFRKYIDRVVEQELQRNQRRRMFSIRINSSRVSIILFGKQILEIG